MDFMKQEVAANSFNTIAKIRIYVMQHKTPPMWSEMIRDLVNGAGYSYSRIAYRAGVTSASIQKLATIPERVPRERLWVNLIKVYYNAFYRTTAEPSVKAYIQKKSTNRLAWIGDIPPEAWQALEQPKKLQAPKHTFAPSVFIESHSNTSCPRCNHITQYFLTMEAKNHAHTHA